jgi:hypothetical protein
MLDGQHHYHQVEAIKLLGIAFEREDSLLCPLPTHLDVGMQLIVQNLASFA